MLEKHLLAYDYERFGMCCQDASGQRRPADFDYFEYSEREYEVNTSVLGAQASRLTPSRTCFGYSRRGHLRSQHRGTT
jgi:hypothetical protein